MELEELKLCLRGGWNPSELPGSRLIDEGCYRKAYRIGDYVVKRHVARIRRMKDHVPSVRVLAKLGLHPPEQWRVKDWIIQPYYPAVPCEDQMRFERYHFRDEFLWRPSPFARRVRLDLHYGNIGLDAQGRQVLFDW